MGHSRAIEKQLREAVLVSFCDPLPQQCSQLQDLSLRQWTRLLQWLDYSGLALYFYDRVRELDMEDWLPAPALARIQQNLQDNTKRTNGMICESIAIQRAFQSAGICYAVLKGLSLWPHSVPRPELRSQFDLDFLVAEKDAPAARKILEDRGYRLYAVSGKSSEFKRNERPGFSLSDMYKDLQSWIVELHTEPASSSECAYLEGREWREMFGVTMPVLSPLDLFIGQGRHVFKHICGEFMRAAHLVEFRRHMLFHRDEADFWRQVHDEMSRNKRVGLAVGMAMLFVDRMMGESAPKELMEWSVSRLPATARLWVERYGRRVVLGSFPGSKCYLLLQKELEMAGVPSKRSVRESLLPSQLPPPIIKALPNEKLSVRFRRYQMQLGFLAHRMRFHIVEGIRYACELPRWRRTLNRVIQS